MTTPVNANRAMTNIDCAPLFPSFFHIQDETQTPAIGLNLIKVEKKLKKLKQIKNDIRELVKDNTPLQNGTKLLTSVEGARDITLHFKSYEHSLNSVSKKRWFMYFLYILPSLFLCGASICAAIYNFYLLAEPSQKKIMIEDILEGSFFSLITPLFFMRGIPQIHIEYKQLSKMIHEAKCKARGVHKAIENIKKHNEEKFKEKEFENISEINDEIGTWCETKGSDSRSWFSKLNCCGSQPDEKSSGSKEEKCGGPADHKSVPDDHRSLPMGDVSNN